MLVKDVELFIALFVVFIAIMVMLNARWLIKNKVKKEVENKVVVGIKMAGFVVCVAAMIVIYYIR